MTTATKTTATLNASVRENAGKGVARALRREGRVPGVVYSHGKAPISISLKLNELTHEYQRGRFRSRLIDLKLDNNQTVKALPKDLQFHPVTDIIEHVDFIRVEAGAQLRVQIPVRFLNQDKSPGLKRGGVLNVVRHEIEFTCSPESIPAHIDVSVEGMEIGQSVHINDLKLPAGVVPVIKRNFTIAAVAGRKAEEEETKPTAAAATADGAAPAEGAAAAPAEGAAAAPAADAKKDEGKKDKK
jgi:large subunit ribosomal protein L25